MQLTIVSGENIASLEVSGDLELENLVALCHIELPQIAAVPINLLRLIFNGNVMAVNELNSRQQLQVLGLKDGDIINIEVTQSAPQMPTLQPAANNASLVASGSRSTDIAALVSNLVKGIKVPTTQSKQGEYRKLSKKIFDNLKNGFPLDSMRASAPLLAETYEKNPNDYEAFYKAFLEYRKQDERKIRLMHDETSEEGQRYIAEMIARQNIDFSHQYAMEHMPEAFIPVHMLYIRIKINGQPVMAFVDSGAQVSILSESCAKRCSIFRLLDDRYRATAMGVGGSEQFLGRIHSCQVQVEGHVFPSPFDVMANRNIDILFGLNLLRRHHCSIDLQKNVLRFGDGTETPFINEEEYRRETEAKEQADLAVTLERSTKKLP